jgi:hypothetical protein
MRIPRGSPRRAPARARRHPRSGRYAGPAASQRRGHRRHAADHAVPGLPRRRPACGGRTAPGPPAVSGRRRHRAGPVNRRAATCHRAAGDHSPPAGRRMTRRAGQEIERTFDEGWPVRLPARREPARPHPGGRVRADEPIALASVVKLPVLVGYAHLVDADELDPRRSRSKMSWWPARPAACFAAARGGRGRIPER